MADEIFIFVTYFVEYDLYSFPALPQINYFVFCNHILIASE